MVGGLRKHIDKEFLTILDFIGNHKKTFLIAIALNGSRYYDKDSLKVAVATEFANIPGCTNIQMDRISQERILEQLNNENFNSMKYLKEEYMEFKKMNGYRVPYMLMDYVKYNGAPDPIKFANKKSTYLDFVANMENDDDLKELLQDEVFSRILKGLSNQLPIKRIYEFSIIKYLLTNDEINIQLAKNEILKHIESVDDESVIHALKCLNQEYLDSSQLKNNIRCFDFNNGILKATLNFKKVIVNKKYRIYIEDVINYALIRYEKEIGNGY